MDNIVVATDLSARSDRALNRAALLARQFSATLHVVHVIDDELPKSVVNLQHQSIEGLLNRQIVNHDDFRGIDVNVHLLLGDAWKEILKFSVLKNTDIIVLGTHRARGFLDRFSGTTIARVAASNTVPTLVVAQQVTGAYCRPLVAVDFSKCAGNAARLAAKLVPEQSLTLLHAYHIPFRALTTTANAAGEISMKDKQRAEAELQAPMQSFEDELDSARTYEWLLIEGAPTVVLDREARRLGTDVICVGPHARSWLSRSLLGSTTEQLLADPPCDVLVTPL
ncbi:universal stress protein [Litoreibacter halocynthiae]|uniref:universal stress protein n=1 Tax=Litoreibacter halocynthiae TaxID=1242689 RepID=UPI0024908581|nr:universal stress protein [Litoreibacter halocynthiae]